MALLSERHPENVPGDWYVDERCINCDVSRQLAPGIFGERDGQAVVARQPQTEDERLAAWRAALACPTQSIGTVSRQPRPSGLFPEELAQDVFYCGYTSERSFGAHSYFVRRPEGNLLVDSPRWTRALVEPFEAMGGIRHILLTHQDDVADADRYARHFGARVWIHEDDARAAPFATDHLGEEPVEVQPGVIAVPVPGHTAGSVAFVVNGRYLLSGDSLAWNRHREDLHAFRRQCWYSWPTQADSLERLARNWPFEWVLPGHGDRHGPLPAEEMRRRLLDLVGRMRDA
jgi:glyoxylase-like metal-dependent hydrolase (beta-lactamase superfamily II)/ferredoxin